MCIFSIVRMCFADEGVLSKEILAGDRLRISVEEQSELNDIYAVAGDGTIDFPLIGRILISDMTPEQAAAKLAKALERKYFKQASVQVNVAEFVDGAILVMGAVKHAGSIPFKGGTILTLVEAITMSGGLTGGADGSDVKILRWKPGRGMEREIITVDVQSMFEDLDFSKDQFLRPRDIVMIPQLGGGEGRAEFLALGEVLHPGFHPYSEGMDIIRAITRIGGVSQQAKMDAVRLLRSDGQGNYTPISVDLSRLFGAADMTMNLAVKPGDILFVPSAAQATGGQVFLLGAVKRQGPIALPLNQEMTLARTILTSGGFGEYANDGKVKILRTAPDGSKQNLIVNVGRILKTGSFEDDVPLRNGDVVIVPERILGF
jgi:polysaccharide export outer membrane protein